MFFVTVDDRSVNKLIPIIKDWIKPGTTVHSDCWKAYSSLQAECYIHNTVNNSIQIITDSGIHTNTIESCWNSLKKSLSRFSTRKELYTSYFTEYRIRQKYLACSEDKFLEVLRLIHSPTRELRFRGSS